MKPLKKLSKNEMKQIKGSSALVDCTTNCFDEGSPCTIAPGQPGTCTQFTCTGGNPYWRCA